MEREQRLESVQRMVRAQAQHIGDTIDIPNSRTWEPAVTEAARALRVAA